MTRLSLLLLFVPTLLHADTTVRPPAARPSGMPGGIAMVTLLVNPLRAASSAAIEISGQVRVDGGRAARATKSVLEVRDAAGKVVVSNTRAFLAQGERVIELGLGFSSSAGPNVPALPAGDYVALWTLDGVRSNEARFAIGPGDPPPLVLERASDGRLIVHLFSAGPGDLIDLPGALEASTLIVDGKRYERRGLEWDGSSGLPRGRGWSSLLDPSEYGAPQPKHTLALELGRWHSPELTW